MRARPNRGVDREAQRHSKRSDLQAQRLQAEAQPGMLADHQVSKEAKEFTDKLGVRQQEAELERVRADLKRVQEQLDKIESQPGSVAAQLKALEDDIAEQNLLLAQFQSNKARQIKNQEPLLEIITTITATRAQRVTPTGPSLEELQARRDTLEATIRVGFD